MTETKPTDVALLQRALDDLLSGCPNEFARMEIVHAWVMAGLAEIARTKGRQATMIAIRNLAAWVKHGEPANRWPD